MHHFGDRLIDPAIREPATRQISEDRRVATPETERTVTWADLPTAARLFRIAHVVWGIFNLAGLAWIWQSAVRRRRDPLVYASMALLSAEGVALIVGRGDCPFGPFQARLGDPVPMFELILPPRAAKAAVPVLTIVSLAGFAAVLLRPPRRT